MQSLRAPTARGGALGGIARRHPALSSSPSPAIAIAKRGAGDAALLSLLRPPRAAGAAPPATTAAAEPIPMHPPAAETARTVMALAREGALATVSAGGGAGGDGDDHAAGGPLSSPVAFGVARDGRPYVTLPCGSPEALNLERDARCSVLLAPAGLPARRVAAVALRGRAAPAPEEEEQQAAAAPAATSPPPADAASSSPPAGPSPLPPAPPGARHYLLDVASALYYGELDGTPPSGAVVRGADLLSAEPCLLRDAAPALVDAWNGDRAEDVYRVAAAHLGVPLARMAYAELLWVDRLGVYVRAEVAAADGDEEEGQQRGGGAGAAAGAGGGQGSTTSSGSRMSLVRVPFQRAVIDERDARSALTMAAQIAWEGERSYVPPVPAVFGEGAVAAAVEAAAAAAAAAN